MAYYARPDEDLAQLAISVVASAEDAEYPAENIISENGAKSAKLTTTTGSWVFEFADAVAPVAVALLYQYLDAGLEVRIQGNATDSWGSPSYNQTITIPAKRKDGPSYQRWTVSPWRFIDLEEAEAYEFWRVVVVGTNSQAVAIGRVFLASALHQVDLFHDGGSEIPETDGDPASAIEQPTELGVETILQLGGPRRTISAIVIGSDVSAGSAPVQDAADLRALHESAEGRAHPFLFIPFEDRNDAWLPRFESPLGHRAHRQGGYQVWQFAVREVSRGLPWP